RCDHGDTHAISHGAGEVDIIPRPGAVSIDAREEDLAGTAFDALLRPVDGVQGRRLTTPAHIHLPAIVRDAPLRVDAGDDALRAESRCRFGEQCGPDDGGAIDAHLVG